jgi:hypothetical protein
MFKYSHFCRERKGEAKSLISVLSGAFHVKSRWLPSAMALSFCRLAVGFFTTLVSNWPFLKKSGRGGITSGK